MCSMYWTLTADIACPNCGVVKEQEMQTHWMGEVGSCVNYYQLGQKIEELKGIQAAVADGEFGAKCDCTVVSEWHPCFICEGTGKITLRGSKRHRGGKLVDVTGEDCDRCNPPDPSSPQHTFEERNGVRGWIWSHPLYFDVSARIVDEAIVEVWAQVLTQEATR